MADGDFGCYRAFYDGPSLRYLSLLQFNDQDEAVDHVRMLAALRLEPSWAADTLMLLEDDNWRSQLPPLVSYAVSGGHSPEVEAALWACIGRGSWVIPQIVTGLSILGADMIGPTSRIMGSGIHLADKDSLIRHVESGPGDDRSRLGKLINSLIGLGLQQALPLDQQRVLEIAGWDFDHADSIAARWRMSLLAALGRSG